MVAQAVSHAHPARLVYFFLGPTADPVLVGCGHCESEISEIDRPISGVRFLVARFSGTALQRGEPT